MDLRILTAGVVVLGAALAPAPASAQRFHEAQTIECSSRNFQFTRCDAPWYDARLVQQTSETRCDRGRTWGVDRQGLWVSAGCAGVFRREGGYDDRPDYGHGHGGGEWRPGRDWDSRFAIRCASDNYNYNFCAVDVGHGGRVYLRQQVSNTPCLEGRNWGWNRAGVWVNGGCEGVFDIDRRWR